MSFRTTSPWTPALLKPHTTNACQESQLTPSPKTSRPPWRCQAYLSNDIRRHSWGHESPPAAGQSTYLSDWNLLTPRPSDSQRLRDIFGARQSQDRHRWRRMIPILLYPFDPANISIGDFRPQENRAANLWLWQRLFTVWRPQSQEAQGLKTLIWCMADISWALWDLWNIKNPLLWIRG